jgi:hypothetical protein
MPLAGQGLLGYWWDIPAEALEEFYEWHNREHMPERLGNAGFRRGRRYIAIAGRPQFLVLYETNSPETIAGPEYLMRRRYRTPWSTKIAGMFQNPFRTIYRVAFSLGLGQGGTVMCWRYDVVEGREEEQRRFLAHRVLPAIVDKSGIAAAHLCIVDREAVRIEATEIDKEPHGGGRPYWLILVEGGSTPEQLAKICDQALPEQALLDAGATAPIERGLYQLQHTISKV